MADAVEAAVRRAVRDGHLDATLDGPVIASMRVVAGGLDQVNAGSNPYGAVRLAKELREAATCLRLVPGSRTTGEDWTAEFLRMMATPDTD